MFRLELDRPSGRDRILGDVSWSGAFERGKPEVLFHVTVGAELPCSSPVHRPTRMVRRGSLAAHSNAATSMATTLPPLWRQWRGPNRETADHHDHQHLRVRCEVSAIVSAVFMVASKFVSMLSSIFTEPLPGGDSSRSCSTPRQQRAKGSRVRADNEPVNHRRCRQDGVRSRRCFGHRGSE